MIASRSFSSRNSNELSDVSASVIFFRPLLGGLTVPGFLVGFTVAMALVFFTVAGLASESKSMMMDLRERLRSAVVAVVLVKISGLFALFRLAGVGLSSVSEFTVNGRRLRLIVLLALVANDCLFVFRFSLSSSSSDEDDTILVVRLRVVFVFVDTPGDDVGRSVLHDVRLDMTLLDTSRLVDIISCNFEV